MRNRRAFYRHPYHYPVKIVEDQESVILKSVDISLGGICVDYKKNFTHGQKVRVEIPLSSRVFKLRGEVCYSLKKGPSGSLFRIGIAFSDKSSVFMAKMAEEILCIQKMQKRMSLKEDQPIDEEIAAETWIQKHAQRFADYFQS